MEKVGKQRANLARDFDARSFGFRKLNDLARFRAKWKTFASRKRQIKKSDQAAGLRGGRGGPSTGGNDLM